MRLGGVAVATGQNTGTRAASSPKQYVVRKSETDTKMR